MMTIFQKSALETDKTNRSNWAVLLFREIKKLYDEGILTEDEFKKSKKKILDI